MPPSPSEPMFPPSRPGRVPLVGPCLDVADREAMREAAAAGTLAHGPRVAAFENALAASLGAAGAIATNSGTSALVLALKTLGIGPGDEVVIPSYTCVAVLNAVAQTGATAALADNECDWAAMDFNVSSRTVSAALGPRAKAVVVPHLFGVQADLAGIARLGIPVIEDLTHTLGAPPCLGGPVRMAISSLHESKMISAGEGGFLASASAADLDRARFLNGWAEEQASLRVSEGETPPYELRYNFHMTEVSAALGLSQLAKLPAFLARRERLAEAYRESLRGITGLAVPRGNPANLWFRFIVGAGERKVASLVAACESRGVELGRGVFPPLHRMLRSDPARFPGAERATLANISVPLHPGLDDAQARKALAVVRGALEGGS